MKRTVIKIDEKKCNGCGDCVTGCHEGALQIIDGKARLVNDLFCDGLGACIGTCPEGAITLEEKEAQPYDEIAVMERVVKEGDKVVIAHLRHLFEHNEKEYLKQGIDYLNKNNIKIDVSPVFEPVKKKTFAGCPGSQEQIIEPQSFSGCPGSQPQVFNIDLNNENRNYVIPSRLTHWPIQLHLVNPLSQSYRNADLLLAADCTAFSMGNFHNLLENKSLAIACPKLDSNKEVYVEKLVSMITQANLNSITVVVMEVPCCSGLVKLAELAVENSGYDIPVKLLVLDIRGNIISY
jgi:NAD-dependent dihydropyrimidine dehydrogenase PreA subunit